MSTQKTDTGETSMKYFSNIIKATEFIKQGGYKTTQIKQEKKITEKKSQNIFNTTQQ